MAWSWKSAGKGAGAGALTGAGLGSTFGPIGLGVGSLLGGAAGLLKGGLTPDSQESSDSTANDFKQWLFNTPEGKNAVSRFSPDQIQALTESLRSGRNRINNPLQGFDPIRQNALNTFNQNIVPSIAHRFSVSGDNALSSPLLYSQLGGAGAQLSADLAAQEAKFGQENVRTGIDELRLGLSPQYDQGMRQSDFGPNRASRIVDLLYGQFQDYLQRRNEQPASAPVSPVASPVSSKPNRLNVKGITQAVSPFSTQKILQGNYNA